MRTYAQKQNQPQRKSSIQLTRSNTLAPAARHEAHPILNLQRTIGNQAVLRLLQARADGLAATSHTEIGPATEGRSENPTTNSFAHDFSRVPGHGPTPITIPPKLTVNTPGDIYEQEADHISEQVMRMPEPKLQRDCGGGTKCQPEEPSQEHQHLQTKQVGPIDAGQIAAPPRVQGVLASPGQPLDSATRSFFEPRFAYDFSRVRVHSGAAAEQSARDLNAHAYTLGHNMVFGAGRFIPGTADGQRLVAHELAHVVQQSRGGERLMRAPATGLEALPEQTRQSLSFDTLESSRNFRLFFGLEGELNRAKNVEEDFELVTPGIDSLKDEKAKRTLWRGLRAYALGLFDLLPVRDDKARSKRFNMVHIENLDLSRWGGPDTAFRFTCIGGETAGMIKVKILVEQLDVEHQPMAAESEAAKIEASTATTYRIKRGDAVPDPVWNKVLRSLGKFPETLLMRIRDVTIETSGEPAGDQGRQAKFVDTYKAGAWKRQIVLYSKIMTMGEPAFAFLFTHEVGHAIDAAPTQGATGRGTGYVYNDAGFKEAARKDGGRTKALTSYEATLTSDSEFFAECLAMYVQQPQTLKLLRPNIYAWFVTYDQAALKDPKLNPRYKAPGK